MRFRPPAGRWNHPLSNPLSSTVLNINPGYNEKLLSACKPLKEYAILIETIKEYRQKYDEEDVSKIQKNYDIAKEFAPDYNVEKIMAKLG